MPAFTLSRRRAIVVVGAALALVFAAAHFFGPKAQPAAVTVQSTRLPAPSRAPRVAPVVVIDVAGAVVRPGVYRLPQGSRVTDAIARAGGTTPRADAALVNLAAPLADGQQVLIPARGGGGAGAAAGSVVTAAPAALPGPVDLNTATAEQLDALPGVGPVTAEKIVAYRTEHGPFASVDELDAIPGIGPARIADLRGLVRP